MVLEVKRKERESNQGLTYRFLRGIQQSRILLRNRKARFRQPRKSEQALKTAALRREKLRKEYEKLKKLGRTIGRTKR